MSTRLPADLLHRDRLDGQYRLRVAAVRDVSKPLYNAADVTTVRGGKARNMPLADDADTWDDHKESARFGTKRLLKVVFADASERLLIGYEHERWTDDMAAHVSRVGSYADLHGPIVLLGGVAMLKCGNIAVPRLTADQPRPDPPSVLLLDDWIQDVPSDLFSPSADDVIVIDE